MDLVPRGHGSPELVKGRAVLHPLGGCPIMVQGAPLVPRDNPAWPTSCLLVERIAGDSLS